MYPLPYAGDRKRRKRKFFGESAKIKHEILNFDSQQNFRFRGGERIAIRKITFSHGVDRRLSLPINGGSPNNVLTALNFQLLTLAAEYLLSYIRL